MQKIEIYKNQNGNYRTKYYNSGNKKNHWMGLTANWKHQNKETTLENICSEEHKKIKLKKN